MTRRILLGAALLALTAACGSAESTDDMQGYDNEWMADESGQQPDASASRNSWVMDGALDDKRGR